MKQQKKPKKNPDCIMFLRGNCNSDYRKGKRCSLIKCPYKNGGSFAMAVRDQGNRVEQKEKPKTPDAKMQKLKSSKRPLLGDEVTPSGVQNQEKPKWDVAEQRVVKSYQEGFTAGKVTLKCTGCGETPTLCDKCNQEICANGQEEVAEQARKEMIEEFKEKIGRIEFINLDGNTARKMILIELMEITSSKEKGK